MLAIRVIFLKQSKKLPYDKDTDQPKNMLQGYQTKKRKHTTDT